MSGRSYQRLPKDDGGFRDNDEDFQDEVAPPEPERPQVYYGDGEFDAPSSDSEDEALLDKPGSPSPGRTERGVGGRSSKTKDRPASLKFLIGSISALVFVAVLIGVFAASSYSGTSYSRALGTKKITMDHVFNGTFYAGSVGVRWIPEAGDGVYVSNVGREIQLVDLKTNETKKLFSLNDIRDAQGRMIMVQDWRLSPDMKSVLVKADYKKQWRHSSFGNYYVYNLDSGVSTPIIPPSIPPVTSYATWSPDGQYIAFVASNDLYIHPVSPESQTIRVTDTGNASLFHGVPDWVYEEEVFAADFALWWSPDSSKLAYLSFDETQVPEFKFPIFNPTEDSNAIFPYTQDVVMKYPKPGFPNPIVSLNTFDLEWYMSDEFGLSVADAVREMNWDEKLEDENRIIFDVTWVDNQTMLVKEVNRGADSGSVVYFDYRGVREPRGRVVRVLGNKGEEGDDGWIESNQFVYPLPPALTNGIPAYLDIVNNSMGYSHIALFSPADSGTPIFLTSGTGEITGGIKGLDIERGLVYFQAAYPSSVERNLFSANLPPKINTAAFVAPEPVDLAMNPSMTDVSQQSWFEGSFSPKAGYWLKSYKGPNVPWQTMHQIGNSSFTQTVTDNMKLNETISQFQMPIVTRGVVESDGYELNVMEIRPPTFDDSGRTKYPVLFRVYGGPGSQMVHSRYEHDWHTYLACSLKYIIVVVDGRGTGFKGRNLRNPVNRNLGYWETKDQINVAKLWASKTYVDTKRIGIWGWSYGGFMSSKVIEAGAGIHSLAIAVAPVTSWKLYDSIYTERYMGLPERNPAGYVNASIAHVGAFKDVNFMLAHGSGDDNVHFANSAHLLDMFTREGVRSFKFRMFTDSDHSIGRRGAYRELHEYMTDFLMEKWGKGGSKRLW